MIERSETFNLHGRYGKYLYYGKYTSYGSAEQSYWEVRLFDRGKKFQSDSIFDSKELLAKRSGSLPNISMSHDLLRQLAAWEVERDIERWDAGRS